MIGVGLRAVPRATGGGSLAYPPFQALGTTQSSTGNITVSWPTHVAGDVGILLIETSNQPPASVAGWTLVANSGTGTAGSNTATAISVYYRVAVTSAESAVTVADTGNHTFAVIATYRGVDTSSVLAATPVTTAIGDGFVSSIAVSGVTTTSDKALVLAAATVGYDTTTPEFISFTNSSLVSVTMRANLATDVGNGGCIGLADGGMAVAGTTGTTTVDYTTVKESAVVHFALKPVPV